MPGMREAASHSQIPSSSGMSIISVWAPWRAYPSKHALLCLICERRRILGLALQDEELGPVCYGCTHGDGAAHRSVKGKGRAVRQQAPWPHLQPQSLCCAASTCSL